MALQLAHTRASPATSLGRASSFFLLLLAAFLLCIRPATSLYTPLLCHDKSLLERPWDKLVPRVDPWIGEEARIAKGRLLHCAMVADQQTAIGLLGSDKAVGRWTDYGDLVRYGWSLDEDTDPEDSLAQDSLVDGHIYEELSIDKDQIEKVLIEHIKEVTVDGRKYKPSMATYQNLFGVDAGLLVSDNDYSPRNKQPDGTDDDLVPLKQWSDMVFLLWQKLAGSNARGLRHHIQCPVANDVTAGIMRKAIGEDDTFSDWASLSPLQGGGRTFWPGSEGY